MKTAYNHLTHSYETPDKTSVAAEICEGDTPSDAFRAAAIREQQRKSATYARTVIDALYENGDPVSVDAAELLEQITQPSKPLTDERPVSTADELPNGFVPLQKENGRIVYAACMDSSARHYKWLMWLHPDGQWVSKRRLEDWEVMQVEDQEYYGIVQKAAHGIKE